jgi:hypothetical protein
VNRVRAGSERANEDDDCGGGLRSRMETFAFRVRRRRAVASPSPLEPPETMNVRSWIFMCARGIGEGEETARSDVRFSCGGQFTAGVQCLVKKSNQDGSWHTKVLCDAHGQLLDAFSLCPGRRAHTCTCLAGIEDRPDGYVDAVPEDCTPFLSQQ